MTVPLARYRASRQFLWAACAALAIATISGWVALRWEYAWIAAFLALATAILLLLLALQPAVEIFETHLRMGRRAIPWTQIRRVDRAAVMPLVVRLTLADRQHVILVYGGDPASVARLLRDLRRHSREALIDGVPYRQFWGEPARAAGSGRRPMPPPRYPILLAADEAEVERLFRQLKTAGRLEPESPSPKSSKSSSEAE